MRDLIDQLTNLITPAVIGTLTATSIVMFVASVIATPYMLARIPVDYFKCEKPHLLNRMRQANPLGCLVLLGKNLIGVVLVLAGVIMLFTPGQGMLTILIGMLLLDFPGKYHLERRIIGSPKVLETVNWMREKAGRPPLEL